MFSGGGKTPAHVGPGALALWHRLASLDTASPKVWMNAYLSAFAIAAGLRMVSLDQDFRNFVTHGLDLVLIHL